MIKTIASSQLKKGMYIHELECSWIKHPFARNQFKIQQQGDIKKIQSVGIKSLKIDTSKGLDLETRNGKNTPEIASSNKKSKIEESEAPLANKSLKKTRKDAKKIKSHAEQAISNIMADIKLGQQVEMEQVTPVVDKMAESVLNNHNALLGDIHDKSDGNICALFHHGQIIDQMASVQFSFF
jgi:hypothetical protein